MKGRRNTVGISPLCGLPNMVPLHQAVKDALIHSTLEEEAPVVPELNSVCFSLL